MGNEGTHHIGLTTEIAKDVVLWLISGEPGRTEKLYAMLDMQETLIETNRKLPAGRGYLVRDINGKECKITIGIATSGMGLGSTEIIANELIPTALDASPEKPLNIIRTGSSGSHQPHVHAGDVVIADKTYAPFGAIDDLVITEHERIEYHERMALMLKREQEYRNEQEQSNDFTKRAKIAGWLKDINYNISEAEVILTPPCNADIVKYVQKAAEDLGLNKDRYHTGPVFSKQTLFSECYGTFKFRPEGIRQTRLDYRSKVLHDLGVCASEMEIAMLTSLAHLAAIEGYNVRVGGIMAVFTNPRPGEGTVINPLFSDEKICEKGVYTALKLGLETAVQIYKTETNYWC